MEVTPESSCAFWRVQTGAHVLVNAHILGMVSLDNGGPEVLWKKRCCFPRLLCISSQRSGLNWKQVKQISLIGRTKLSRLTPHCAVENWGEGFVKMKKDQVARCACVTVHTDQKKRGNYKAVNLLIMNG